MDSPICSSLQRYGRQVSPTVWRVYFAGSQHAHLDVLPERVCLEASLPSIDLGTNIAPVSVPSALRIASDLFAMAEALVPWEWQAAPVCFSDLEVPRVDWVRDFCDVTEGHQLLNALQEASYRRDLPVNRYMKRGDTLSVERTRWKASLYDKWEESGGTALPGHLRYEVTLRTDRLQSDWAAQCGAPIRHVHELDSGSLSAMGARTFQEVGFGTPLEGFDALPAIVAPAGFRGMEAAKVTGLLVSPGLLDRHSGSGLKYRKLMEGLPLFTGAGPHGVVLDYDAGRLVITRGDGVSAVPSYEPARESRIRVA